MLAPVTAKPYNPKLGRPVHTDIAGDVNISIADLTAKLGATAYSVWHAMVMYRSESGGVCHATLVGLARKCGRSQRMVRYGLARLKRAGLVRDAGWRTMLVYSGERLHEQSVYVRTVYGALVGNPIASATIPRACSAWFENAFTHGGVRPGMVYAGPTQEQQDLATALGWETEIKDGPYHIDVGNSELRIALEVDGLSHRDSKASRQKTTAKTDYLERQGWCVRRFKNEEIRDDLSACVRRVKALCRGASVSVIPGASVSVSQNESKRGASVSVPQAQGGASMSADKNKDSKTVPVTCFPTENTLGCASRAVSSNFNVEKIEPAPRRTLGERLALLADRPKPRDVHNPILVGGPIPPYPSTSLCEPAQVPRPPMVNAADSDYDKARMIVNAYCGACTTRLGKPCKVLAGKKALENSKYFPMLVKAANLLHEKKISPFAWAAWWLDNHLSRGREDRPPVQVLFGNKSVGDHVKRNIFRKNGKRYGGRVIYGDPHKELLRRYEDMRQHLRTVAFENEAEVAQVVSEHFPPGEWGILLAAVQKDAQARKDSFSDALRCGGFLW